jgi:hypothetical protein
MLEEKKLSGMRKTFAVIVGFLVFITLWEMMNLFLNAIIGFVVAALVAQLIYRKLSGIKSKHKSLKLTK